MSIIAPSLEGGEIVTGAPVMPKPRRNIGSTRRACAGATESATGVAAPKTACLTGTCAVYLYLIAALSLMPAVSCSTDPAAHQETPSSKTKVWRQSIPSNEPHPPIQAKAPPVSTRPPTGVAAAADHSKHRRAIRDLAEIAVDQSVDVNRRQEAIRALGHHRSRGVAKILIGLTADAEAEPVRQAAYDALATLSGISNFGSNRTMWKQWWNQQHDLSSEHWLGELLRNFEHSSDTFSQRNQLLLSRLTEAKRQLYRAQLQLHQQAQSDPQDPTQQQPNQDAQSFHQTLLGPMLEDELAPIRSLALELSSQRLIDGQPIGPKLRPAVRQCLNDPSPEVRQRATRLLHDLVDEEAARLVADRLLVGDEYDLEVLDASLSMMARLPQPQFVNRALDLLAHPQLSSQAAGVIASSADAGLLNAHQKADAVERVRNQLRGDVLPDPRVRRAAGTDRYRAGLATH